MIGLPASIVSGRTWYVQPRHFTGGLTHGEPLKESHVASKSGPAITAGDAQHRPRVAPEEGVTLQGTGGYFHPMGRIWNS